jgi:hypothetical protein
MTVWSQHIEKQISYAWNDWGVTERESKRVIMALLADPKIDATINDLDSTGSLIKLYDRMAKPSLLRQVVAVIASRSTTASSIARLRLVELLRKNPILTSSSHWLNFSAGTFFDICRDLGINSLAHGFASRAFAPLSPTAAPADPSRPFTGTGATGDNPAGLSIGWLDQLALATGHSATVAKYSNPIPGSLTAYLSGLSPRAKLAQARTLVHQPISTLFPKAYRSEPPLRSRVIHAAGLAHRLEPQLISAAILAEQRDQSRNEDAKDYIGATSIMQGNTSIGLGQVVVSTAIRNDLFSDLLTLGVRKSLTHNAIATLLASDEFNIFATARYIRIVANAATRININTLPNTKARFPAINMRVYGLHSRNWPLDNVRALASEYTSRAWDDRLSPGWPNFVEDAYTTFKNSRIVFP